MSSAKEFLRSLGVLIVVIPAILGVAAVAPYVLHSLGWMSDATFYSQKYNLPRDKISVELEPHDCDFMKAPIGEKYCHYEKHITVCGTDKSMQGAGGSVLGQGCVDIKEADSRVATATQIYINWEKKED